MSQEEDQECIAHLGRSKAMCVQGWRSSQSALNDFQAATLCGSPTSVDVFGLHCSTSWQKSTVRLALDVDPTFMDAKDVSELDSGNGGHHSEPDGSESSRRSIGCLDLVPEDLVLQILDLVDVRSAVRVFGGSCRRSRQLVRY
jgi:hypothetical protein